MKERRDEGVVADRLSLASSNSKGLGKYSSFASTGWNCCVRPFEHCLNPSSDCRSNFAWKNSFVVLLNFLFLNCLNFLFGFSPMEIDQTKTSTRGSGQCSTEGGDKRSSGVGESSAKIFPPFLCSKRTTQFRKKLEKEAIKSCRKVMEISKVSRDIPDS